MKNSYHGDDNEEREKLRLGAIQKIAKRTSYLPFSDNLGIKHSDPITVDQSGLSRISRRSRSNSLSLASQLAGLKPFDKQHRVTLNLELRQFTFAEMELYIIFHYPGGPLPR